MMMPLSWWLWCWYHDDYADIALALSAMKASGMEMTTLMIYFIAAMILIMMMQWWWWYWFFFFFLLLLLNLYIIIIIIIIIILLLSAWWWWRRWRWRWRWCCYIEQVSPSSGPTQGGTLMTIYGSNLGRRLSDVEGSITVANVLCDVINSEYVVSKK